MSVSLRQVDRLHAGVLSALHVESFGPAGWSETAVSEVLAMPGAFGFLVLEGETPLGFVLARLAADECEILALAVTPGARGRGLARALLDAALRRAADGCARVVHLEVSEENHAARALYESRGFRKAGRRAAYYRGSRGESSAALILNLALCEEDGKSAQGSQRPDGLPLC
ncbi:MAG: GNAT family N-acetyltransferase [Rhodospirillales bacterium]|nr:GNAT family N-acetyltransferase [Rhodospirillales bacterium]